MKISFGIIAATRRYPTAIATANAKRLTLGINALLSSPICFFDWCSEYVYGWI